MPKHFPAPVKDRIAQIVSGGQSGVDRAALDVALELGISCGGWCPKGRRAEDGIIDPRYPLKETESTHYRERTARNVESADGTLILTRGELSGGTALTRRLALAAGKPCLVLDLKIDPDTRDVEAWIAQHGIKILNIAGPRASQPPEIHADAHRFLSDLFAPSTRSF